MFLTGKRHRFLHPRFSLFTMFISNKIFLSVPSVLTVLLRFFLSFLIIRSIIFIITTLSFSIRDIYTIRIYSRFKWFLNYLMFLFLSSTRTTTIFTLLGILLYSFRVSFRI